jgi:DNA helicase-2/ATP-dependent DNA helicase PcrA
VSDILSALDEQQRAAAECLSGPVVIYAGAGTGKTRTITHRIAYAVEQNVYEPTQTLAVTFTARAAGELRSRLGSLGVHGVQVRTFHSAALRQLRFFYPQYFATRLPDLVTSKFRYVADAVALCHVNNSTDVIRDVAAEIEWAKVNILSPESYRTQVEMNRRILPGELTVEQVSKVYEAYLKRMDEAHLMDFEDVLLNMTAMLENIPEVATAIHRQYRHFTVDEFQDVSPVQFELLSGWLGQRSDVCVVGDPAQTIYSFSGATSSYLTGFAKHFPTAQQFELATSYRSTPQIITAANSVLAKDGTSPVRLHAIRPAGPSVAVKSFTDDEQEAQKVARSIASLIAEGVSPRDIAVLYRINSQSEILEAELGALGIPATLRGAERFFERPEVRTAMLHLRAALVAPVTLGLGAAVRDILSSVGWKAKSPESGRAAQETWESLNTVVELADDMASGDAGVTLPEFVTMLDKRNEQEHVPSANAVTLASIHSAKGLEWEAVFVVGLSEGLLPISHANTPTEFAEERRLFYVAITRARTHLQLSWAGARRNGTKAHRTESTLLRDLKL